MKRPIATNPARVHQSLATGTLTPHEAAARLARIEFDTARLEREIDVASRRIEKAQKQLRCHDKDRSALLRVIAREKRTTSPGARSDAA